MEIIRNIYQIPGVIANAYLIVEPEGLTLIDAGLPGSNRAILKYIGGLGRSPRELHRILITHGDLDHVGGLAALRKATGGRVFSSSIESQAMAEGHSSRKGKPSGNFLHRTMISVIGLFFRGSPGPADELLSDRQILPILGGLRAVETAGHTPGHLSFYLPSARVLFTGDSIIADEKGLQGSRPMYTWDAVKAAEAVRKQSSLGAQIICPGHGPVVRDAAGKFPSGALFF